MKFKGSREANNNQIGQGMTEYIIIVALIAVAAIGAYSYFGETIRHQVAGLSNEIAGKKATTEIVKAGASAGKAVTSADKKVSMGTYDEAALTEATK